MHGGDQCEIGSARHCADRGGQDAWCDGVGVHDVGLEVGDKRAQFREGTQRLPAEVDAVMGHPG